MSLSKHSTTVIYSLFLTVINYIIAYLLSSKEVLFDFKNIGLIFLFSYIWLSLYKLYGKKKTIICLCVISSLIGFLIPALAFKSEAMFLQRLMKDFLFGYTLLILPILINQLLSMSIQPKKKIVIIDALFLTTALFPLLLFTAYYTIFGVPISVDSLLAVLQSNRQESLEFILTYTKPSIIFLLIAFGVLIFTVIKFLYSKLIPHTLVPPQFTNVRLACLLTIVLVASNIAFAEKTYWARTLQDTIKRHNQIESFTAESAIRKQQLNRDKHILSTSTEGNFALIIGETHARSNMSAYGYRRNTTPWLTKYADNDNIILLKNGFSNAGVTTSSLEYALTAKNQYNNISYANAVTITEIAQASGFNVVWISNQVDDNIVGRIGHEADQQYWLNKNHNDTWLRQKNQTFDDRIINCLKSIAKPSKKTLYIINLLGSHASYNCRYPSDFNKWDDSDSLLNAYDNSVLYNDYIMSNIHKLLFEKFAVDGMLYFADHGEELKLKFCHGTEYFYNNYKKHPSVKEIVKIPIYFSFSNRFKQENPELISNLKNNQEIFFTNDMIYDTMLGLMQIPTPYYQSKFDITSNNYSLTLKDLRTIHGKVKLEDCL